LRVLEVEIGRAGPLVEVELTPNITEQGRKASDLLTLVEGGELDLCYFSSSYLAGRVPSLRVLDLPFLVTDRERAYWALDGDLGKRLADDIGTATGFRVLAYWDNGFRHFSNRLRPIRHPRDCQGMKIRTLDNALHQQVFRALGLRSLYNKRSRLPEAREKELGVTWVDTMDDVFREADFLVVACALTNDTIELIKARHFELMKPSAFFINTARGRIVVERDLIDADADPNRDGGAEQSAAQVGELADGGAARGLDQSPCARAHERRQRRTRGSGRGWRRYRGYR
jgi:hypothetical protein